MFKKNARPLMFAVLSLVYMVSFVQAVVMTVVANDVMRDMDLTPAGMGRLGSFYLYGYSGLMLFSGMITAWLGPRKTLSALCCLSAVGGLLFSRSDSFAMAALGRMLCGMGLSSNMTSAFTIFTRWFPAGVYSRLCAAFVSIGGVGTFIGAAVTPTLNAWWGWRDLFAIVAGLTFLYAVLVVVFVRDWPEDGAAGDSGSDLVRREKITPLLLWRSFLAVAGQADFWKVVVWFAALAGVFFAFGGLWAVPYLKEVYSMSHSEAGAITSVVAFGYIVGAPLVSVLGDRVFRSYRVCLGVAGALTAAAFVVIILLVDSMSTPVIFLLVLLVGMCVNGPTAVAHASARNLFGARMAGIVSGLFGCSAFLGGALLQMLCGELLYFAQGRGWPAASGYALAFSPFIACGALACWCGFTISRKSFPAR